MKKTVKISMYLDCTNEYGIHNLHYVCSVWGDRLEFVGHRWYLRDSYNMTICCGDVIELHSDGTDEFDVKYNVVCY